MKIFNDKHIVAKLILLHTIVAILRILFVKYGFTDLQSEEAQYWAWSEYLDWSYYSKPPIISYLNFISEWLLGHGELAVRINSIVIGFTIGIITFLFSKAIFKDNKKAFIASLLIYTMPFYHGVSLFFSTDTPLLLFWLLASYWGWLAIEKNKWKYWILFATALGLGYLSKFAMLFFIPSIVIYAIMKDKELLRNKRLYGAFLISFLFFLPVLIWNINNDFVTYKHLLHLSGAKSRHLPLTEKFTDILEYISGQWAIASPLFIVMYFRMAKKYHANKITIYLLTPLVLIFSIFFFVTLQKTSAANVNWTMFTYSGLPILLASYIVDYQKEKKALTLSVISVILLILFASTPTLDSLGLYKIFPADRDPAKKLIGWEKLAQKVDSIKQSIGDEKVLIFTTNYHITSELRFYMHPQKVLYVNIGSRMNQYDMWNELKEYENKGYKAIFVQKRDWMNELSQNPDTIPPLPKDVLEGFTNKTPQNYFKHDTKFRGETIYSFHIYVLSDFTHIKSITHNY